MQPCATAVFVVLAGLSACSDPVRSREIDALGGETPGVAAGPLHRPGQPCVLCHGGEGPGGAVFSFGGTIYQDPMHLTPLSDAIVEFIDSKSRIYGSATNCAGNFFVMKADYSPQFPVWVKIQFGTSGGQPLPPITMESPIYRDGSCAACHGDPLGTQEAGHVYLAPQPVNIPNMGCL